MEKTIVTTGKTIDLAIESALNQLGLDRDSVSVTVLQQAKTGFLGFGAQPAKVQVAYEVPDPIVEEKKPEPPKSALGAASRSKPKKPAVPPVKKEQPAPQPKKEQPAPQPKKEPAPPAKKEPAPQEKKEPAEPKPPRPERRSEPRKPRSEPPKEYTPAEPGSVEEKIEQFLKGLLERMDSKAVPHCWKDEEGSYRVDLVGDDLGYLIGRRGETLDAIQHLTNYTVNQQVEGRIRVNVDAEHYRQKREDSLRRYARKKAQQVLKNRRRTTLEPMNAYERHIIHAALQDMENITTHSTGVEPNRRVVIEYVR